MSLKHPMKRDSLFNICYEAIGWVRKDGVLHCDSFSLQKLRQELQQEFGHGGSPAFVYSKCTLIQNVLKYTHALRPLGQRGVLSYAVKANSNPRILKILLEAGVTMATTVSGNEILMALHAGFQPSNILLNGNGKQRWEIELAVSRGMLLNIDSLFDAEQVVDVAKAKSQRARVLLRLNPALDAQTHPYLTTALADSKFGIENQQLGKVLDVLDEYKQLVDIEGIHIHVGSAITQLQVYAEMMKAAVDVLPQVHARGWNNASLVNLGGGLNVELPGHLLGQGECKEKDSINPAVGPPHPTPAELVKAVMPFLPMGITLMLEPGRSLVATAGVVMADVLGSKVNGEKFFIVVDAAMTEVIRPALYGARHEVSYVTSPAFQEEEEERQKMREVNVVGPVCESGDFLALGSLLPVPPPSGAALVVWMAGAYCSSMSSNYNLRPHALEVIVTDPQTYEIIRKQQQFRDLLKSYE